MKLYRLFFVFLLFSFKSFATAQVPDYLIVDKDTLMIQSNPLEDYFKEHPMPKSLNRSISTANWRGYVAYFKFLNGKLVVENIYKEDYSENEKGDLKYLLTSIYKEIFGDRKNFECNFYSGLLICPSGKMLEYVHMGYSSVYENYDLIEIKNGVNIKSKKFTGKEFQKFKMDYFKYFKQTDEYKLKAKEFKEMMAENNFPNSSFVEGNPGIGKENQALKKREAEFRAEKQVDSFMYVYLSDYIKTIEIPTN
ncbi:hypothetical protein SAMN06265349_105249 [Flavobacterium resistens]|uniref:GLPGLI family protein n=1 Tax=Flavobacterium resistens TaxID=443612 RepID=A0A521EQH1_9FLAO|nr:hypothetical protein [Flavobacterium resistens]MRX67872.1 hypothetical protein [Flavobacterium resistens]SMO86176.1 hypothetical protein SAMN06265349_105249 [Flavobacterium resistens]